MVHSLHFVLATGSAGIDPLSASVAFAAAFPAGGNRGSRRAGAGVGDCHASGTTLERTFWETRRWSFVDGRWSHRRLQASFPARHFFHIPQSFDQGI